MQGRTKFRYWLNHAGKKMVDTKGDFDLFDPVRRRMTLGEIFSLRPNQMDRLNRAYEIPKLSVGTTWLAFAPGAKHAIVPHASGTASTGQEAPR